MRIFILNNVYKIGSTGKIVHDTKECYENLGHKVKVAYGIGVAAKDPDSFLFCTKLERYAYYYLCRFGGYPYRGSPLTVKRIIKAIRQFNPDIIHVHCMNCHCVDLYGLLDYLSNNDYKVVITHHAEFYYTGSCPHAYNCNQWINSQCNDCLLPKVKPDLFNVTHQDMWQRMYNSFNSFKENNLVFTAVSPWVKSRADMSPITNKYNCVTVMNGVDTNRFHLIKDDNLINKEKYQYIAFHASASFSDKEEDPKGGKFIIDLAKINPSILFVVAALYVKVNDEIPKNLLLWGPAKSGDELAKLYSNADITIICSKRETFSMITAESLCCGTPVVGFEAGGPESIAIQEYTQYVEYGNITKLNEVMYIMLDRKLDKEKIALQAKSKFSKERMSRDYLRVYEDLIRV